MQSQHMFSILKKVNLKSKNIAYQRSNIKVNKPVLYFVSQCFEKMGINKTMSHNCIQGESQRKQKTTKTNLPFKFQVSSPSDSFPNHAEQRPEN